MKHTKPQIVHIFSTFKGDQRKVVMKLFSKANAEFAAKRKIGFKMSNATSSE